MDTYKVDVDRIQNVPIGWIIKPGRHGLCFYLYPKIEVAPEDEDKPPQEVYKKQVSQFYRQVQWHEHLVYVKLHYVHDMEANSNH